MAFSSFSACGKAIEGAHNNYVWHQYALFTGNIGPILEGNEEHSIIKLIAWPDVAPGCRHQSRVQIH